MKLLAKSGNENGLSMIEVLIALILGSLVLGAVFHAYIIQSKNWNIQTEITDMQQNARAAINEIARQVRMAGHELPLGINPIIAVNTDPDTIVINYSADGCNAEVEFDMGSTSANIRFGTNDISCFSPGQSAYIFHPDSGGSEFFIIDNINLTSGEISHSPFLNYYYKDAIVLSLDQIKYFIDKSDTLHHNLMVQYAGQTPQVYAENIDDLQFTFKMKNGTITNSPVLVRDIREVRILITSRTANPDPDFPIDPYRRKSYVSKVNLRNLDI
ncbi:MAG: prepilin-type N-terminal cleavage/methylation domain-containing protein [Candidatus Zixiibacteriota bacterium]